MSPRRCMSFLLALVIGILVGVTVASPASATKAPCLQPAVGLATGTGAHVEVAPACLSARMDSSSAFAHSGSAQSAPRQVTKRLNSRTSNRTAVTLAHDSDLIRLWPSSGLGAVHLSVSSRVTDDACGRMLRKRKEAEGLRYDVPSTFTTAAQFVATKPLPSKAGGACNCQRSASLGPANPGYGCRGPGASNCDQPICFKCRWAIVDTGFEWACPGSECWWLSVPYS